MLCDRNHPERPQVLRVNPSFPVNRAPTAYQTLPEIKELVRATLLHLGEDADRILATVKVGFSPTTTKHGLFSAKSTPAAARAAAHKVYGRPARSKEEARSLLQQLYLDNAVALGLKFSRDSFTYQPLNDRISIVVHETCHLVDFIRNKGKVESGGHGASWAALMQECGERPDVTAAMVGTETYPYIQCKCEGGKWRHARVSDAAKMAAALLAGQPLKCARCMTDFNAVAPEARDARAVFDRTVIKYFKPIIEKRVGRAIADARSWGQAGRKKDASDLLWQVLEVIPGDHAYNHLSSAVKHVIVEIERMPVYDPSIGADMSDED